MDGCCEDRPALAASAASRALRLSIVLTVVGGRRRCGCSPCSKERADFDGMTEGLNGALA